MKRIVALIDGTWDKEGVGIPSNVAKLDPNNTVTAAPFIKPTTSDGNRQLCLYHAGVGADGDLIKRILGGAIGLGLKQIIREAYNSLVDNYEHGDEVYILGFSRGAYVARALAGLIGASGIQKQKDGDVFEAAWRHYRLKPSVRKGEEQPSAAQKQTIERYNALWKRDTFHIDRTIKCVGVWDTVGSYGIPAGFGLAPLARYVALLVLGFHDTQIGNHIEIGLHAIAVDERRRPFAPTFWTTPRGMKPRPHVEQTWFAGVHCNVGGGYVDCGLSDRALIWMIARIQTLTNLEFDVGSVRINTNPDLDGAIEDSSKGWLVSGLFPYKRPILPKHAIRHGFIMNYENPDEEHINERVHYSVIAKRGRPGTVYGVDGVLYEPPNLAITIPRQKIANITPEEKVLS